VTLPEIGQIIFGENFTNQLILNIIKFYVSKIQEFSSLSPNLFPI